MKASVQKPKKKPSLVDTLYYKPKEESRYNRYKRHYIYRTIKKSLKIRLGTDINNETKSSNIIFIISYSEKS